MNSMAFAWLLALSGLIVGNGAHAQDVTPPTAPNRFILSSTTDRSVAIFMMGSTDNVGVTAYLLERCQGTGCTDFVQVGIDTIAPTLPYADLGLTPATTYNYRCRASDAAGNLSPYSVILTKTTLADTTPPVAPASLMVSAPAANQIGLVWTAATDDVAVTNYLIERCQGAGCSNFAQIGITATTSYSDRGVLSSTTYLYRVRASDAASNLSPYSSSATITSTAAAATTFNYTYDDATRLVAVTYPDSTETVYKLDAAGNRLFVGQGVEGTAQFDQASYSVNTAAGTLTINVTRTNGSEPASIDYASADGTAVSGASHQNYTAVSGTVNWPPGDVAPKPITIPITSQSSYGSNKSFNVTLSNPVGVMVPVASATVTIVNSNPAVPPSPPTGLTAGTVSAFSASFSWSAPTDIGGPGIGSYQVYRSGTAVGTPSATTNFADTGLTPGTLYNYTVVAIDLLGKPSAASAVLPITTLSTVQITDSAGNVLPAAQGLYQSSSVCSSLLQSCFWSLTTTYGTPTVVFSIRDPQGTLTCPAGGSLESDGDTGYSRAPGTCAISALPSVYGQPPVAPSPTTLSLSPSSYPVVQSNTSVTVSVTRTGDLGTKASVNYNISSADGSAILNTDYAVTASSGTLSWAVGQATTQTFPVTILAAGSGTGAPTKTINLSLTGPTAPFGSAVLGTAAGTIVISNTAPGVLQLDQTSYSTSELQGSVTLKVSRTAGNFGAAQVQYQTVNGTATAGTDYTMEQGTLSWASGDNSIKSIVIPIANLGIDGASRAFSVTLSNATGASLSGGAGSVTVPVTITDSATYQITDDSGNVIPAAASLYTSTSNCTQPFNTCIWTLSTSYGTPTVVWTIRSGTTLACPAGGQIQSSGDNGYSRPSSTSCQIRATPAAYGQPPVAPQPGTLSLSASSYAVLDNAGSVPITVTRTGGTSGAVSVTYATADGSAISGSQYTGTINTLAWADGDATSRTINIPITDNNIWSTARTFTIALSSPTGSPAPALGTTSATVTITYSEPGALEFTQANYQANETDGTVSLAVARVNGGYGAVGVSYATSNGSALAGSDYTATSGALSWANGVASNMTLNVPIINSGIYGPSKTFTVSLASPTGGATVPTASATVTITDNNPVVKPTTPTGLTVTSATPVQVSLSWGGSTDVGGPGLAGYRLYKNGAPLTTTTSTSYTDTAVSAGANESYAVTAYDTLGTESLQDTTPTITVPSTYQISTTSGAIIAAATGLYTQTTTCVPQFNTCVWRLSTAYGTPTVVFAINGEAPNLQNPCTSGQTTTAAAGYSRPDGISCQIVAAPTAYGH